MTEQERNSIFDKFVSDYNNKPIKIFPNNYPPQCFEEAVKFTDLLGVPHVAGNPSPFPYPNAYQIYTDFGAFQAKYFDRIPNTPDYVPKKGDTVVWAGSLNGGIGHVATATGKGDTNSFEAFSQNWPLGSNAHLMNFSYNHVLGALRYKVSGATPSMDRRPYWFDLINKVVWNKPYEQVTDAEVNKFVSEYPSQRARSGKWDQLCIKAGLTGDSNVVTVDQLAAKLKAGFTQADVDAAYKKGRVAGINEIDAVVHKLLV